MIRGYEDYTAEDLAGMLMGDEIQTNDLEGTHGALLLLCKRVSELECVVEDLEKNLKEHEATIHAHDE